MNDEITATECRQLREIIRAVALPGVLNRSEYAQIILALNSCANRMEAEGGIIDA